MKHWNAPKNDRGFTLTEVLVVSVIFSILAAISVPNLLGLIYKARVTDGVASIEGAIKEAKSQAIRNSQRCSIEIATDTIDGETRAVVRPDPAAVGGNNDRCLFEQRVLPSGVTVTNNTPDAVLGIDISSKGNIGNTDEYVPANTGNWTITVTHNDISTSKCLRVEGLFGDVQTGIVQGAACNTDL